MFDALDAAIRPQLMFADRLIDGLDAVGATFENFKRLAKISAASVDAPEIAADRLNEGFPNDPAYTADEVQGVFERCVV